VWARLVGIGDTVLALVLSLLAVDIVLPSRCAGDERRAGGLPNERH